MSLRQRRMMLEAVLPVGLQIYGRTFPLVFPESKGEFLVQLNRAPSEQSEPSEEQWILSGVGFEFRAEADAAIRPDGTAATRQWRHGDKHFTLVILEHANGLRGFFVSQYAEEFNIPRMPSNLKDHEVSSNRSWTTYIEYLGVAVTKIFVQIGDCSPCVSSKLHND